MTAALQAFRKGVDAAPLPQLRKKQHSSHAGKFVIVSAALGGVEEVPLSRLVPAEHGLLQPLNAPLSDLPQIGTVPVHLAQRLSSEGEEVGKALVKGDGVQGRG